MSAQSYPGISVPGITASSPPQGTPNIVYSYGTPLGTPDYVSPPSVVATGNTPANADNAIYVSSAAGTVPIRNYPLRVARVFMQGEIENAPQAVFRNAALPTQADIKLRWPDGSVKHAILSCILPEIKASREAVLFKNQPGNAATAPTTAQMLSAGFDFEAIAEIYQGSETRIASARKMLEAGDYKIWCAGPIATTIILADHSEGRKYDFGFDSLRPIRPIFHVTFWHAIRKVHVRVIAEIANTESMADVVYGVRLFSGLKDRTQVFRQDAVPHTAGTRWTRNFWSGEEPGTAINIDHNLGYLTKTNAVPNFDLSLKIPESEIAAVTADFGKKQLFLYGIGFWMRDQGTAGGRDEIGHFTGVQTMWLYTGDHRVRQIVEKQADLAGAWPSHVREGNSARWYDGAKTIKALGRPVSVFGRPALHLFKPEADPKNPDRFPIHGSRLAYAGVSGWGGWRAQQAHEPDPYSMLYLLTGDYFALEQMQMWAAAAVVRYDPAARGPVRLVNNVWEALPSGGVMDEVRGLAWTLRSRVAAAELSPDGTPEKAYFNRMLEHMFAFWEGRYDIRGTAREKHPLWKFGREKYPYVHPLHFAHEQVTVTATTRTVAAIWQQNMLIFELGEAKDKGYDTGPLLDYLGATLTSQFLEPGSYGFHNVGAYWTGTRDKASDAMYPNWTATLASYPAPNPTNLAPDPENGYFAYAYAASTKTRHLRGGQTAYEWLRDKFYKQNVAGYARRPKWAFLPR